MQKTLRMFLLNKMFKLRDKVNPEEEKPFLDHLEDLRVMVTRVALTLLISTLACFVYKDDLMTIIRKPVEQVWIQQHEATLPKDEAISLEDWENALTFSSVSAPLQQYDAELTERWWDQATDEKTRRLTEAAILYRAAIKLDLSLQEDFLKSVPDNKSAARDLALKLLVSKPAENLNAEGNLRLMSSLKPTETFMLSMKLAFFAGIIISFPILLYFLLQFIVPGLKDEERKALWPALAIGFGLFLTGVLFAYFFVLPEVLVFFSEYGKGMGVSNDWRIGYYISFATTFVLIFGLAFELPVVVMTFVKLGLLSHSMMRETRSYAILAIFVIAALITPTPDMMTLSLLAVPMVILYEICIWLSYFHEKKAAQKEAEEEEERMASLLAAPTDLDEDEDHEESDIALTEEGEEEDVSDDYMDYPGEHHSHEEDPNSDPLTPDDHENDEEDDAPNPDDQKRP